MLAYMYVTFMGVLHHATTILRSSQSTTSHLVNECGIKLDNDMVRVQEQEHCYHKNCRLLPVCFVSGHLTCMLEVSRRLGWPPDVHAGGLQTPSGGCRLLLGQLILSAVPL